MKLSIIIPAYNEEKRIGRTLEDYCCFFCKKYKRNVEIIVVLNRCIDNTLKIVKKYAKRHSQIKYLNLNKSGKGFAIIEGFKIARGDLIGFTDADDSTSAGEFNKLTEKINGLDGIIASRYVKGAVTNPKQPLQRIIVSRIGNLIIRLLFHLKIKDTQCGAKLFRKNTVKKVLPSLGVIEWGFDIDLLYRIKKNNFKIKEAPILWKEGGGSKLKIGKASLQTFFAVIRLRLLYSPFKFIIRAYGLLPENIKFHHKIK